MAFDIGSVIAKIDADISGFKKGMADAKNEANTFGNTMSKIGAGIGAFAKQATIFTGIVGAGMIAFGKASVDAFNESEAAQKQQAAVLKSTGNAAGLSAKQLEAHAQALQSVTKYSDEAIMGGQNILLTFTNIKGPIFTEATGTILDMSTALGQDLKSSAIQLGKALQDPILGVTALRRVGVNFNEEQQNIIKGLVESGKSLEAQKMILAELKTEFGGSAAAAGKSFGGQIEILKNKLNDLQERLGAVIAGFVYFMATGDLLPSFLQAIGMDEDDPRLAGLFKLRDAFVALGKWISENKELVTTFLQGLAIGLGALLIVGTIAGAIALLTNPLFLVVAAITALYVAWQTNFGGIRDITMMVITEVVNFFNTYLAPAVAAMVATFLANWQYLRLQIEGIWKIIIGIFQIAWAIVYGVIKVGLAILSGDWKAAWDAIVQMLKTAWEGIKNVFGGILEFIQGWGGQLFDRLTAPFRKAWDEISKIVEKIKGALDFTQRHSPSILDIVKSGVGKVNDALGDLAISGSINADAAGVAVSRGGNNQSTTVIRIDMAGAFIADQYGANQMAEYMGDALVRRLQNNVRL